MITFDFPIVVPIHFPLRLIGLRVLLAVISTQIGLQAFQILNNVMSWRKSDVKTLIRFSIVECFGSFKVL